MFLPPPGASIDENTLEKWETAFSEKARSFDFEVSPLETAYLNSLVLTQSPYLLQHATNPVNWNNWSDQSLEIARARDRLIFLSIGYSTCHWCHVMNRESFSDPEIAELINRNFVAIKVDREEMPAIDQHYSNILTMVKGSAGWPLTAILDSEGNAILVEAYLDPAALRKTLTRVAELADSQPASLKQSAQFLASLVPVGIESLPADPAPVTLAELAQIGETLMAGMDQEHGGQAGQQKFPNEPALHFLLALEERQPSSARQNALELQLTTMATGGLYDAVNGGFFRYSTEPTWRNPHYEKMLYNQAQLLSIYSRAYTQTNDSLYAWLIDDDVQFLNDWLYEPEQGYRSAIDAETEGIEGLYYLWDDESLGKLRSDDTDDAGLIAYQAHAKDQLKGVLLQHPDSASALTIRRALRQENDKKTRPFIDDKIITAWNAAVISGMAEAFPLRPANKTADNINQLSMLGEQLWSNMYDADSGVLYRTLYQGERAVQATLEDYAYLLAALIDLYDLSGNRIWLERADTLSKHLLTEFLDDDGRLYSVSNRFATAIAARPSNPGDAELAAADAVALGALSRLAIRQGDMRLQRKLELPIARLRENFRAAPYRHLYAGGVLAEIDLGSIAARQYFAAGNGRVDVTTSDVEGQETCETITIAVDLEPGWHVNSSQPLQDYLIPTKVSIATTHPQETSIDYPDGYVSQLSFQDEALSVYDGEFAIDVTSDSCTGWAAGAELTINLQACTDEFCMLPEVLRVMVPRGAN